MNLSDDKSDNMFSDNYNDDSFFKDGDGADLLSDNNAATKAQNQAKSAAKPVAQKASSIVLDSKESQNYNDASGAFEDNYDDFGFDSKPQEPVKAPEPVVAKKADFNSVGDVGQIGKDNASLSGVPGSLNDIAKKTPPLLMKKEPAKERFDYLNYGAKSDSEKSESAVEDNYSEVQSESKSSAPAYVPGEPAKKVASTTPKFEPTVPKTVADSTSTFGPSAGVQNNLSRDRGFTLGLAAQNPPKDRGFTLGTVGQEAQKGTRQSNNLADNQNSSFDMNLGMNLGESKVESNKLGNNIDTKDALLVPNQDYNFSRVNSKDAPGNNLFGQALGAGSQGTESKHSLEQSGHFGTKSFIKASEVNSSKQSGIGSQGLFNPLGLQQNSLNRSLDKGVPKVSDSITTLGTKPRLTLNQRAALKKDESEGSLSGVPKIAGTKPMIGGNSKPLMGGSSIPLLTDPKPLIGGGTKPAIGRPMIGGKKEPYKAPPINPLSYNKPLNDYGQISSASKPLPSVIKPGTKDSNNSSRNRNVTVTEEELEDENSVMDGSYVDKREKNTSNIVSGEEVNETITSRSRVDITPRTEQRNKGQKIPFIKGQLGSGRLDDDKSVGDISGKYSAVVFTNPKEQAMKAKELEMEQKSESSNKSEEEYSDDDFEDDFEPYETSNEGETEQNKPSSGPSKQSVERMTIQDPVVPQPPPAIHDSPQYENSNSKSAVNLNILNTRPVVQGQSKPPPAVLPKSVSKQHVVNSKNNTITSKQDQEEIKDKVNDLDDDFYEGNNRVRIRQKSTQDRKYGNRHKASKNNFSSPQKKKLNHYVIPKNIHPLQAIQNGLNRAQQQLQIARILKVKQQEELKEKMLAGVVSDNASIGGQSSIVQGSEQRGYADIKKSLLNNKNIKKLNPVIMAQIENGISSKQYLLEGALIMQDVNHLIDNLKDGNYNNYVGSSPKSLTPNAPVINQSPQTESMTNRALESNQGVQELLGQDKDRESVIDNTTVVSMKTSVKYRRAMQIRKLEKEYQKIQRRLDQATDPVYIADTKAALKEAELQRKQDLDKIKKLETEQSLLDREIQKNEFHKNQLFNIQNDVFGVQIDKKTQLQQEVLAGMEIQQNKVEAQVVELQRMNQDNEDLQNLNDTEQDKNAKLVAIAQDKYKMNLTKIDNYMPRGPAYQEKMKILEKKMIQEAVKDIKDLRHMIKSKSVGIITQRKTMKDKEDKIDLVKIKLKNRALAAQKLLNKAMELGQIEKVRKLQDMNIKVFSLLNLAMDDIPSIKSPSKSFSPVRKSFDKAPPVPESNFFSLTSGDDNPYDEKKKTNEPLRVQKSKFEAPQQTSMRQSLQKSDNQNSNGSLTNMYVNKSNASPQSSLKVNSNLMTPKPPQLTSASKNPLDATPVNLNEKSAIEEKEEDIDEDDNYSEDYSDADKSESKSKTQTPVVATPKNEEVQAPQPVLQEVKPAPVVPNKPSIGSKPNLFAKPNMFAKKKKF